MIFTFISGILSALFYQNVILTNTAGLESNLDNRRIQDSFKYGIFISLFALISFLVTYPIYQFVLKPHDITFLNFMIVIVVIILLHVIGIYILDKLKKETYKAIFSKVVLNSVVVFITVMSFQETNFIKALALVIGSLLGHTLIIGLLSTINLRLETSPKNLAIKGLPMLLILLGVMAVAFKGLAGIF